MRQKVRDAARQAGADLAALSVSIMCARTISTKWFHAL
jgi:hypothetical protein